MINEEAGGKLAKEETPTTQGCLATCVGRKEAECFLETYVGVGVFMRVAACKVSVAVDVVFEMQQVN